jgi:hypothetical protein
VQALACALALLVPGCGGESGPLEPTGLAITLGSQRVQITRSIEVAALNTYPAARDEHPDCDWYVDGILGGNAMKGTVTQTNPATFTAPSAVPAGGAVEISAVLQSDSSFTASDTLAIVFTVRYGDAGAIAVIGRHPCCEHPPCSGSALALGHISLLATNINLGLDGFTAPALD